MPAIVEVGKQPGNWEDVWTKESWIDDPKLIEFEGSQRAKTNAREKIFSALWSLTGCKPLLWVYFQHMFNALVEQTFAFKNAFFSIIRCMMMVEDVERRAPVWNLTLSTSKDHMGSFTWKRSQESAKLWVPLWQHLTEETPNGSEREFDGTSGRLHSSSLGPTGKTGTGGHTKRVLTNVVSRFKKIPSVHFQLRWLLGAWQLSGSSRGGWGGELCQHPTSVNYWVFGSLLIKIPDTRTKVSYKLLFSNDNLVNIWI